MLRGWGEGGGENISGSDAPMLNSEKYRVSFYFSEKKCFKKVRGGTPGTIGYAPSPTYGVFNEEDFELFIVPRQVCTSCMATTMRPLMNTNSSTAFSRPVWACSLGREQAGLSGTGTGFRPVSDQCRMSDLRSPCHISSPMHSPNVIRVLSDLRSHVGSAECLTPMHSVISGHAHSFDRIIQKSECGPIMLVGKWSVHVLPVRSHFHFGSRFELN